MAFFYARIIICTRYEATQCNTKHKPQSSITLQIVSNTSDPTINRKHKTQPMRMRMHMKRFGICTILLFVMKRFGAFLLEITIH